MSIRPQVKCCEKNDIIRVGVDVERQEDMLSHNAPLLSWTQGLKICSLECIGIHIWKKKKKDLQGWRMTTQEGEVITAYHFPNDSIQHIWGTALKADSTALKRYPPEGAITSWDLWTMAEWDSHRKTSRCVIQFWRFKVKGKKRGHQNAHQTNWFYSSADGSMRRV